MPSAGNGVAAARGPNALPWAYTTSAASKTAAAASNMSASAVRVPVILVHGHFTLILLANASP